MSTAFKSYEDRESHLEKQDSGEFYLWLDDALLEILDIDGVGIDARVNAGFKRNGRYGENISLDYFDIRNVYIYFPNSDERNQVKLKPKLQDKFEEKLAEYLLRRAKESFDWKKVGADE